MMKPNYKHNKRQKELSKKAKQEQKLQRRVSKLQPQDAEGGATVEPQPAADHASETLDSQP